MDNIDIDNVGVIVIRIDPDEEYHEDIETVHSESSEEGLEVVSSGQEHGEELSSTNVKGLEAVSSGHGHGEELSNTNAKGLGSICCLYSLIKKNDLIWVVKESTRRIYYLARVIDEYQNGDAIRNLMDFIVRKCEVFKVGSNIPDELLDKICIRSKVQKINDQVLRLSSCWLYNYLSGQKVY